MKIRSRVKGFTIIELIIVIVVIGILATITIVAYKNVTTGARDKSVLSDLDALDALETQYGTKNNVAGLAWYSGPSGPDPSLNFTPSPGDIIDVVVNSTDYCIRGYNPKASTYKTLATAAIKESTSGSCGLISPSVSAVAASTNTFTNFALFAQTGSAGFQEWSGGVASSSDGSKLVAGDDCGKIITTGDYGSSWFIRIAECPVGTANWAGIGSSSDGTKLVGVSHNSGGYIYTSTDSGVTWTQRITTPNGWAYVASSSDGSKLVAISRLSPGYIYTSTDSGVTWTQRTGSGSRNWEGVASSSDGTKLVAAENGGYIYTSTDSGVTWTQRTGSGINGWQPVASSTDGTKLIAGDDGYSGHYSNNYIYTSTDSGVTWTQQTGAGSHYWYDISISSDGSKALFSPELGYLYRGLFY